MLTSNTASSSVRSSSPSQRGVGTNMPCVGARRLPAGARIATQLLVNATMIVGAYAASSHGQFDGPPGLNADHVQSCMPAGQRATLIEGRGLLRPVNTGISPRLHLVHCPTSARREAHLLGLRPTTSQHRLRHTRKRRPLEGATHALVTNIVNSVIIEMQGKGQGVLQYAHDPRRRKWQLFRQV